MDKKCIDCKYYVDNELTKYHFVGSCRRYPPNEKYGVSVSNVFPIVSINYWCGEFGRKLNKINLHKEEKE